MRCSNPDCRHGDADQGPDRFYANRERCKDCYNAAGTRHRQQKRRAQVVAEPAQAPVPAPTLERWPALAAFDSVRGENDSEPPDPPPSRAERRAAERAEQARRDAARRRDSDFASLTPDDLADEEYDVTVGNVPGQGRASAQASREKRQEYNARMGMVAEELLATADHMAAGGDVLDIMTAETGSYIGGLGEQERRFGNRRIARPAAIWLAAEALQLRQYRMVAERFFTDKIEARGFATRRPGSAARRSTVLLLSDLHLGSELSSLDEPIPFGAVQEARRLEHLVRETIDYKPHHRDHGELVLLVNGDIIEGQLGHQVGAGSPLAEQKAIFWHYFRQMLAEFSAAFPAVRVYCQPGNHGRDKVRHPGRATWRKWDGHEWEAYYALARMCSGLANVTFDVPFRAVSAVPLHGATLCLTHGDTEIKIGHPDSAARNNMRELDRVNATRAFGHVFDAFAFGHYHTGRYHPGTPGVIYNSALVPPNGHARASGYDNPCGQFLWEAVEGFPIGDVRFLQLGSRQDDDETLGTIITPFRFGALS